MKIEDNDNQHFLQVLDENGNPQAQPETTLTVSSSEVVERVLEDQGVKDVTVVGPELSLTAEERMAKMKQEEQDFLNNEEHKKLAYELAIDFEKYLGNKKWFTLEKAVKKVGLKPEVTFQKLKLLQLFGYCVLKKGDGTDAKQRGEIVFKLAVTTDHKIEANRQIIASLQSEIERYELEIKTLLFSKSKEVPQEV
jgi:hypothetical protein